MTRALLLVVLLSGAAWADVPPDEPATLPDTSCVGKQAGDACSGGGTCRAVRVRRPQLAPGAMVPSWGWTEVLVCEQPAAAPSSSARAWLGAALGFLALLLAVSLRRSSRVSWAS